MAIPAILCWQGGKRSLVKELLRRMPPHRTYVEPFFGAGHLFFAKEPSEVEVINDIDPFLMSFYKKFRDMPSFSCDMRKDTQRWQSIKDLNDKRQKLNVCDYLYLVKCSYGCRLRNPDYRSSTPRCGTDHIKRDFAELRHRLSKAIIMATDWEAVIKEYDSSETFVYLDPPYYGVDCPYYKCEIDLIGMSSILKHTKAQWLLSFNDHPDVRLAFSQYKIEGQKELHSLGARYQTHNARALLIRNYDGYYNAS